MSMFPIFHFSIPVPGRLASDWDFQLFLNSKSAAVWDIENLVAQDTQTQWREWSIKNVPIALREQSNPILN